MANVEKHIGQLRMGKVMALLICLLWSFSCYAIGSKNSKKWCADDIKISYPYLHWVEPGVLSLSFSCPNNLDSLTGDNMLRISPVLIRKDGKQIVFPSVIYLNTSTKRFLDRRLQYRPDPLYYGTYFLTGNSSDSTDVFIYQDTLVTGSCNDAIMAIRYYHADCCNEYFLDCDTLEIPSADFSVKNILPVPVLVNRVPLTESSVVFSAPKRETVKVREQVVVLSLHYKSAEYVLYEDYMDNARYLGYMDSLCSPVFESPEDYEIQSIHIYGYSSPEGDFEYNQYLSGKRAYSFADYVSKHFGIPLSDMTVEGKGEDWDGLKELVKSDTRFPQADKVLEMIDKYDIFEGREKYLMELDAGIPYLYMMEKHFPGLRRIELELKYIVRTFNKEEATRMISTRPQDLDTYELYMAAATLSSDTLLSTNRGREEYGLAYDLAAKLHPEDVSTCINAASAALLRYDLEQAYEYLNSLTENPMAWNNIGVYYWMCGDLKLAREYFTRALSHSPEAEENLEQLNAWEEQSD